MKGKFVTSSKVGKKNRNPLEGEFSENLGIVSKVKIFQNPSCQKLEKINETYDKLFCLL